MIGASSGWPVAPRITGGSQERRSSVAGLPPSGEEASIVASVTTLSIFWHRHLFFFFILLLLIFTSTGSLIIVRVCQCVGVCVCVCVSSVAQCVWALEAILSLAVFISDFFSFPPHFLSFTFDNIYRSLSASPSRPLPPSLPPSPPLLPTMTDLRWTRRRPD